jgi:hypothetical protein
MTYLNALLIKQVTFNHHAYILQVILVGHLDKQLNLLFSIEQVFFYSNYKTYFYNKKLKIKTGLQSFKQEKRIYLEKNLSVKCRTIYNVLLIIEYYYDFFRNFC